MLFQLVEHLPHVTNHVQDKFGPRTLSKWSVDSAETAIRALLFVLYMHKIPSQEMMIAVEELYNKATFHKGYRSPLLAALVKTMEPGFCHDPVNMPESDYPNLQLCLKREADNSEEAKQAWLKEKAKAQAHLVKQLHNMHQAKRLKIDENAMEEEEEVCCYSSYEFLMMDDYSQEAYAFGLHITNEITDN